jgi:hypothetical protein
MAYWLVPQDVDASSATVWIGAYDQTPAPGRLRLAYDGGSITLDEAWNGPWAAGPHRIAWRRVRLAPLPARTQLRLRLLEDDVQVSDASVTTLPDRLPTAQQPFTVLLGSCFYQPADPTGQVGRTFLRVLSAEKPEIKFLCGDQVYLDNPYQDYVIARHSAAELRGMFLAKYRNTWGHEPSPASGFRHLLKNGANFFVTDDHEYWNNAPSASLLSFVRDIKDPTTRAAWLASARDLVRAFQSQSSSTTFGVDPLSFFVLDTRINRSDDFAGFAAPGDLARLDEWVRALRGPGVLVVGQVLFDQAAGRLKGSVFDYNLANYAQYDQLCRALAQSAHSIVVMTGDVHFGRIARSRLPGRSDLIEIIASPFKLVPSPFDRISGDPWQPPPASFPATTVRLYPAEPVTHEPGYKMREDHFATIRFWSVGQAVHLQVKAWPVASQAATPAVTSPEYVLH